MFAYTINNRRASRSLRLSISPAGEVRLSKPFFVSRAAAEAFIIQQKPWIEKRLAELAKRPISLLARPDRNDYLRRREEARRFVIGRLEALNAFYSFAWKRVSLRDNRSRWGSCSRQKNLNFHYRILDLPPDLQDYLIVHELCHLAEFNHSAAFWRLVSRAIPDYQERRRRLKNS